MWLLNDNVIDDNLIVPKSRIKTLQRERERDRKEIEGSVKTQQAKKQRRTIKKDKALFKEQQQKQPSIFFITYSGGSHTIPLLDKRDTNTHTYIHTHP